MFSRYPEVRLSPRNDLADSEAPRDDEKTERKRGDKQQVHPFCRGG
ncbi:hypothetical protein AB0B25_01970 [Nocardia sp. NPDC049190]